MVRCGPAEAVGLVLSETALVLLLSCCSVCAVVLRKKNKKTCNRLRMIEELCFARAHEWYFVRGYDNVTRHEQVFSVFRLFPAGSRRIVTFSKSKGGGTESG